MLFDPKWDLDQASLVLLSAADILEKDGWCQHALLNWEGQRCVLGAIYRVTEENGGSRIEAVGRLAAVVNPREGTKHFHVANWNDAEGRTVQEVLSALRGAANVG